MPRRSQPRQPGAGGWCRRRWAPLPLRGSHAAAVDARQHRHRLPSQAAAPSPDATSPHATACHAGRKARHRLRPTGTTTSAAQSSRPALAASGSRATAGPRAPARHGNRYSTADHAGQPRQQLLRQAASAPPAASDRHGDISRAKQQTSAGRLRQPGHSRPSRAVTTSLGRPGGSRSPTAPVRHTAESACLATPRCHSLRPDRQDDISRAKQQRQL